MRMRIREALPLWLFALFLLALIPRLAAIGRYVTPDEMSWVYRSIRMRQALLGADWANTIVVGHPGITTTWIGAISVQIQLWLRPEAAGHLQWLEQLHWLSPDNPEAYRRLAFFLGGARLGNALVTSSALVAAFWLLRMLTNFRTALVAALLLALDPFVAGHSGLLHVDALLSTFALLAILCASLAAGGRGRSGATLAGLFTALAFFTKTPALLLLPFIPIILLWPFFASLLSRSPAVGRWRLLSASGRLILYWAAAAIAGALLLVPALWTGPVAVADKMFGLTGDFLSGGLHPTYFMGRIAINHGPLYYPVVLALRLSPAATIGLALALFWLVRARFQPRTFNSHALLWLFLFGLAYLLSITMVAQKFDRYLLPALFAFLPGAAWGVATTIDWLQTQERQRAGRVVAGALLLLHVGYLLAALPYPLLAYNWIAGGPRTAARTISIGWGEDTSLGARWLAGHLAHPEETTLFTNNPIAAAPFFPGRVLRLEAGYLSLLAPEDYILRVPNDWQAEGSARATAAWEQIVATETEPVQTLSISGQPYVRLYRGLDAATLNLPKLRYQNKSWRIGTGLGVTSGAAVFYPWPQKSLVAVAWRRLAGAENGVHQLQLELVDEQGIVWWRHETALLNRTDRAVQYWPMEEEQVVFYKVPVPPDLVPGDYRVIARVFDQDGALLPVFDGDQFAGTEADVAGIRVTPPADQPAPDAPLLLNWGNEAGTLVGLAPPPMIAGSGDRLQLDLWWRTVTAAQRRLTLQIGEREMSTTLETAGWAPGQSYHVRPSWRIPADMPPGRHPLWLQLEDTAGRPLWPEAAALGEIEIIEVERTFQLPPGIDPLGVQLGTVAQLQSITTELTEESLHLHVVWQAAHPDSINYTTFVHLRTPDNGIISQADRAPQPPTSEWVEDEVIVETYRLPRPSPGHYTIALGLYDAANGRRLPVYTATGVPLNGDQYLLLVEVP